LTAGALGATTLAPTTAAAAPKHDLCADIGSHLGFGISSYSQALGWPEKAEMNGVSWKFLYYYVFPSQDTAANVTSYLQSKAQVAQGLGATLVVTFYDLLKRGMSAGVAARPSATNGEADIVAQVLATPDLMKGYYDGFVVVLKAAASAGVTTLIHVEPDSWGFMMWAMGVDGNKDPTTVPVKVVSSGQSDLAGQSFSEDAAGFGKALLYLRDKYAPDARMGWHASNFRSGSGGDVVAAFYSGVGEWDAIVTEDPHIVSDATSWWLSLDPSAVDANVSWFSTVSRASHVPILMWQLPIGPFDFHFLGEGDAGMTTLSRFVSAGLAGMMWEQQGTSGDPDTFRGIGLATPPSSSTAGGTALDLRTRLAAYDANPPAWPAGSPCAHGDAGTAGDGGSLGTSGGADASAADASGRGDASSPGDASDTGDSGEARLGNGVASNGSGGCGCRLVGSRGPVPSEPIWRLLALAPVAALRRARFRLAPRKATKPSRGSRGAHG
jgi:hypothetical protein